MKSTFTTTIGMLLFYASFLNAQTYVTGTIDGVTWSVGGSPYIMNGDLLVANLTIEPGVIVMADGDYKIEIAGIIKAVGTEKDSIVFTKTNTATQWQGLFFNVTTFESKLKYCKIEHSVNSGIRIINSTPTIENCMLLNNSATTGGAIHFANETEKGSKLNLIGCSFINNKSSSHGGALYVSLNEGHIILDHSVFEGNISNPSLVNGDFVGGALHLAKGDATILSCSFIGNRSNSRCSSSFGCNVTARGGAIYIGSSGNVTMENNIFLKNQTHAQNNGNCFHGGSSNSYGGAVYINAGTVNLTNNIFAYNSATRTNCNPFALGGGVFVNGGTVELVNCNVVYNADATGVHRAAGKLNVMNSIIFFNNAEGAQIGGECTVTYSDIQNGYTGDGNISNNPVFVKDDSTFHLTSISPCIDGGNPASIYNDPEDPLNPGMALKPALGTVRNDMGAYGGPNSAESLLTPNTETDIITFGFNKPPQTGETHIDHESHIINIDAVNGTDLNMLVAYFKLSARATATVGGIKQESGVTVNDFSQQVIYLITAEDRVTKQEWKVNVNILTGIGEQLLKTFKIYPNPFSSSATIEFSNPMNSEYKLSVYNLTGAKVFEMANITSDTIELPKNNLSAGTYILELRGEDASVRKLFIIQ